MKSADWDVECALNEVIAAIRTGAGLLKMNSATEKGLKKGYLEDFQAQWKANVDWNKWKLKVIPLAVTVGGYAAFLTTIKSVSSTGPLATALDEKLTYTSAWTVAQSSDECMKLELLGGFCRNFPAPLRIAAEDASALARVSRLLGPMLSLVVKP